MSANIKKQVNGGLGTASPAKADAYDWLQCIVTALVCSILTFIFLGRIIGVEGNSMVPTFFDRDKVIMSNLFYSPKQGDIVVLTKESFSSEPIVKRVIALEGQTVNIDFRTGEVWVDGVLLDEPYIAEPTTSIYDMQFPLTVEKGCIFVMGDNRNRSSDSRDSRIGMVDTRCILGKVYAIILPLSRIGWVSHG
ncbi:MAG: signal peptidase I [Clostridiales bacterium]|nr:signal peptidase I [Clostridiales bacterium]